MQIARRALKIEVRFIPLPAKCVGMLYGDTLYELRKNISKAENEIEIRGYLSFSRFAHPMCTIYTMCGDQEFVQLVENLLLGNYILKTNIVLQNKITKENVFSLDEAIIAKPFFRKSSQKIARYLAQDL